MPAVSKGDGMRGLAVFISDIRNCKCPLLGKCVASYTCLCVRHLVQTHMFLHMFPVMKWCKVT
uniref:AP-2 complex subunit alpha-2 n=1 Tax=Esox lucius TaxID=8010 RepID=C1BZN7_ESOLU|nr:AP-2 complex subunit alpha-2 [Esox lucius]